MSSRSTSAGVRAAADGFLYLQGSPAQRLRSHWVDDGAATAAVGGGVALGACALHPANSKTSASHAWLGREDAPRPVVACRTVPSLRLTRPRLAVSGCRGNHAFPRRGRCPASARGNGWQLRPFLDLGHPPSARVCFVARPCHEHVPGRHRGGSCLARAGGCSRLVGVRPADERLGTARDPRTGEATRRISHLARRSNDGRRRFHLRAWSRGVRPLKLGAARRVRGSEGRQPAYGWDVVERAAGSERDATRGGRRRGR